MSPRPTPGHEFILTLSCPDAPGLVYAVSGFLLQHGGNILASQQFEDRLTGRFFIRVHFEFTGTPTPIEELRQSFLLIAAEHTMDYELVDIATPTRTLIMVRPSAGHP
jgi:formyltetrahydrofolate deformylase